LTGWKIDLYSSREWLERGGEGPLFAPLPPEEDDTASRVPLTELKGLAPEVVAILNGAGYRTLNDVLDLDREDVARISGMTPATTDHLMSFLAELTDEDGAEEARPTA
jgi:N utilization substance protein A